MCRKLAYLVIVAALSTPALAGVSVSITGYSANSNITSWPIAATDATAANPSTFSQGENNYGGAAPYSLAQSWTASTGGNLSHIQIVISGTAPVTFNINLFDAGTWDGKENSASDWSDVGDMDKHTFKPGDNVSKNLFSSVLSATWAGFMDSNDQVGVLDLAFDGADQVALTADHQYIFEITSEADISKMVWFRNAGEETNYKAGQAFRSRSPLNANNARDFVLAVTVGQMIQTPETKDANTPAAK
ncbi:MAG: hypothetical protein JW749_08290 [Sedimentisphaerales bacterium]|nr:hypothetical protein [Sedimentisphaerales bacterium]